MLIGQRKTIFVRFANNSEVNCEWSLETRQEIGNNDRSQDNLKF